MTDRRSFLKLAGAGVVATALPRVAAAQAYPTKLIRCVVPSELRPMLRLK